MRTRKVHPAVPAYPCHPEILSLSCEGSFNRSVFEDCDGLQGMSLRVAIAKDICAAMCSGPLAADDDPTAWKHDVIAKGAVMQADALIEALNAGGAA